MSAAISASTPEGSLFGNQFAKKLLVHAGAFLSLAVLCVALWALSHTLQKIEFVDVLQSLQALSASSIALAFAATVASYLVVTGFDVIALGHIDRPLPYWRAALAAFLASAFGNNIGFSLVTGPTIRYRIYSPAGLSALEITGVSTMSTITTMIGMFFILALALVFSTGEAAIRLPQGLSRSVGVIILVAMGAYLVVSAVRPLNIRTRSWSLRLPSAKTALMQAVLGTLDMVLVGTLIYALLPAPVGTSYLGFLGVFVLALMAGGVSHVPGGIGVFETTLLLGLPEIPPAALLGSILVFRCIYFLAPLSLAALLFASYETILRRARIVRVHAVATDWLHELGPQVMAVIIIFAGVVLLFSGTIPATANQHLLLQSHLPLWLVEVSHTVAAATGFGLIMLARGISRRLSTAHYMTAILLGIGIIASYLKGLDYDEAITLGMILALLLPTRREFHRSGSLFSQGFTVEWVSTLTAILAVSVWLGVFNFKNISYSHELWWQFSYDADLSRLLRSMLVVFLLTGGVTLVNLLRPDPEPEVPETAELDRVLAIIRDEPDTRANLALLGDKRLLFSASGKAFIMYQVQGKSWVALGDPVGSADERQKLVWTYRELCDRYGGWPVFYLVDAASLPLYVDLGLSVIKLGDEARVPLEQLFIQSVGTMDIRKVHRRVGAQGVRFQMIMSTQVPEVLPDLQMVSDAWLAQTQAREHGFSRAFFVSDYVARFPCAIVRQEGRIVAFAILWASHDKEELALDLMRYHPDAPGGVMDYLLVELMLGGKEQGYRWFNLGVAPLSSLEGHPLVPVWQRIGKLIYRQSEHFQTIESLRHYEESFKPVWRPKYLASPGGFKVPRILRDIARLTARGTR